MAVAGLIATAVDGMTVIDWNGNNGSKWHVMVGLEVMAEEAKIWWQGKE